VNKDFKSIITSASIILLYIYATMGVVKLFGTNDDDEKFGSKVQLLSLLMLLCSFIFIIGIYHIVGPYHVDVFYKTFIILHLIYLTLGVSMNILSK
jgi:hypothetical membrane protein